MEAAARSLNLRIQHVQAHGPEDLDNAFAAMAHVRAQAPLVTGSSTFLVQRARLAALAHAAGLPSMYSLREFVEAGGLMSYSVNMRSFINVAAGYVDKILRGAKPAELPVEQPTKFELVINLGAAKALGLALPRSLLLRADELID